MHDPGREDTDAANTERGAGGVQAFAGIAAPQEAARSATGETDAVMEEAPEASARVLRAFLEGEADG
jgi:hypothetical protein